LHFSVVIVPLFLDGTSSRWIFQQLLIAIIVFFAFRWCGCMAIDSYASPL